MSSISSLIKHCSARYTRGAGMVSIFLMLALSACSGGNIYTINRTPTATKTGSATPTPKPASAYTYAFARNGQVWIAQAGKAAQQLSQLPASGGKNVTALAWSADRQHLAFEVGGVGNPVDYAINTSTGDLIALNVPSTPAAASFGWYDKQTVLTIKVVGGNTQFWKTDITTNTSSQITQVTGTPQVKVLNKSIYYAIVDANTNQLMLHRYDVNLGSEGTPVAITPAGSSTLKVNWDVSPDGSHVAMGFRLATPDSTWANGFWYINFNDNTDRQPIFPDTEIPFSSFLNTDTVTLSFSPDSQTVVLGTHNALGLWSEGVDDSSFTSYSPRIAIAGPANISWPPNGASFAVSSAATPTQSTIYTLASKSTGSTFVEKANLLQWAPQS